MPMPMPMPIDADRCRCRGGTDADRDPGTDVQGETGERLADPERLRSRHRRGCRVTRPAHRAQSWATPARRPPTCRCPIPPTGGDEGERILVDDPDGVRQRWNSVQVGFVDDPRQAVGDAGQLVDEVVELVVAGVGARQRDRLGETWSADDLDTEQLRLALRQYREFLDRLLAV